MTEPAAKRPWERKLQQAATTVEEELRRVITYINDEVVPEVRQNGSVALRAAAAELDKLARKMEERGGPRAESGTGPGAGSGGPPPPHPGGSARS